MSRKRLGADKSVRLTVRIPGEWHERLVSMSDAKNPVRELVREAIKRLIRI